MSFDTLGNDTVDVFFDNLISRRPITVGSDRAVPSGIMQIVTSAVRGFCAYLSSRVSLEVSGRIEKLGQPRGLLGFHFRREAPVRS